MMIKYPMGDVFSKKDWAYLSHLIITEQQQPFYNADTQGPPQKNILLLLVESRVEPYNYFAVCSWCCVDLLLLLVGMPSAFRGPSCYAMLLLLFSPLEKNFFFSKGNGLAAALRVSRACVFRPSVRPSLWLKFVDKGLFFIFQVVTCTHEKTFDKRFKRHTQRRRKKKMIGWMGISI